ncbi:hypothetical protein IY145_06850 [Methylosinus sp. H3A]|uniref:hypothetical protein n=1 Tax=Methylosinus sp. H3A TaxID=2785786 RepID=UPI0018C2324E|nr:hypothetical protein [Methylosinus sp. H3A]MBG0809092.1 hypothetical protein [Methylosinus sp. H3A]
MSLSVSGDDLPYVSGGPLRARPLGNLAASLMGVAALFVLAGSLAFVRAPQDATTSVAAAPPALVKSAPAPVVAPERVAAFRLEAPEIDREPKIAFDPALPSGGRQETHAFGGFDTGRAYLRLDILQPAGEKLGNSDFFLDVARHAAQAGLGVVRIGQPTPLVTRAGAFEAAEIKLSLRDGGVAAAAVGERSCLAVRLVNASLSMEIAGIACGAGAKPMDRRAMGCLLDRVYYLPSGENKALARSFPKVEGPGCLAAPSTGETEAAKPAPKKRAARH